MRQPPIADRDVVRISQPWNPPHHYGKDYSCYVGTPIVAAEAGVAYPREQSGGFGRYVVVETDTHYVYAAHLSEWWVKEGERVIAGQVIGLSGNTGNSTGPHLHHEVRAKAGSPYYRGAVDPDAWLAEGTKEQEGLVANIIGWHLGNGNAPTDIDWRILEAVPPRCVVFLPDEGTQPDHLSRLLSFAPGCHIIMRPYYHPGAPLQSYIDQCKASMDRYRGAIPEGQRHVQMFNEQNMPTWAQWEGFGDQLADMQRFDDWFVAGYSQLKRHDPTWKLGWTPLTPGNRDVWFPGDAVGHYYLHGPSGCAEVLTDTQVRQAVNEGPCKGSIDLADEYYAHVYIHEGRGAWSEPWRGLRFERMRRFLPDKPLWITECGFPNRSCWPDWGDAAFVEWLGALTTRNVEGIAAWILGDKEQWGRPWYEGGQPRPLVWTLAEWQREHAGTPTPIAPEPPVTPPPLDAAFLAEARAHKVPQNPDAALYKAIRAAGQEIQGDEWAARDTVWQWGYDKGALVWHLWGWTPGRGAWCEYSEEVTR